MDDEDEDETDLITGDDNQPISKGESKILGFSIYKGLEFSDFRKSPNLKTFWLKKIENYWEFLKKESTAFKLAPLEVGGLENAQQYRELNLFIFTQIKISFSFF